MICPTCHGSGKLTMPLNGTPTIYPQLPCRECSGSGIASCCDAAGSAQPDATPDETEGTPDAAD